MDTRRTLDTHAAFNGSDRGYDADINRSWHGYIVANLAFAAVLVGLVLTYENQVTLTHKILAAITLFWTVVVWGQLFEGHNRFGVSKSRESGLSLQAPVI